MGFRKATKEKAKLRLGLVGPTGSGKTYTALLMAEVLAEGGPIALIDTEKGSASKYASGDPFDFDVEDLASYHPLKYVECIENAAEGGYPVLIIDSLTHAWTGVDGALDQVDRRADSALGKFGAWRDVNPMHTALVDAMLSYPGHVIATMRAKTAYVLEENKRGKQAPRKIGLAPVQREGMSYEFDLIGDIDFSHTMTISKSRCAALADQVIRKPGAELAQQLLDWLSSGADPIPVQVMNLIADKKIAEAKDLANKHRKRMSKRDELTIRQAFADIDQKEAIEQGLADAAATSATEEDHPEVRAHDGAHDEEEAA